MPRIVRFVCVAHDAALGREHHPVAPAANRPADQLLVGERAVHVGGVEQRHAEVEGAMDGGDRLRLVARAVELAHPHAPEADGGDLERAESSRLHAGVMRRRAGSLHASPRRSCSRALSRARHGVSQHLRRRARVVAHLLPARCDRRDSDRRRRSASAGAVPPPSSRSARRRRPRRRPARSPTRRPRSECPRSDWMVRAMNSSVRSTPSIRRGQSKSRTVGLR